MKAQRAVAFVMAAVACGAVQAQDARPLPDPDALYATVKERLARAERVAFLYAFKERRTDVHTNPFGRIGTGGSRLIDVYPSATRGLRYRRLIERNGVPLSTQELAEQDKQYAIRAASVLNQSADERQRREADAARARLRGQQRIDDVVGALQLRIEGRAIYKGVPAIVIAFTPKPGARPESREGRTAQRFAGKVWIDEAAGEVMRVEARSVDDISFGLGLVAKLGAGTEATLTRQPIDGDLWMPTQLTLKGRGRRCSGRS